MVKGRSMRRAAHRVGFGDVGASGQPEGADREIAQGEPPEPSHEELARLMVGMRPSRTGRTGVGGERAALFLSALVRRGGEPFEVRGTISCACSRR